MCLCVCQEVLLVCGVYCCVGRWVSVTAWFFSFVLSIVLSHSFRCIICTIGLHWAWQKKFLEHKTILNVKKCSISTLKCLKCNVPIVYFVERVTPGLLSAAVVHPQLVLYTLLSLVLEIKLHQESLHKNEWINKGAASFKNDDRSVLSDWFRQEDFFVCVWKVWDDQVFPWSELISKGKSMVCMGDVPQSDGVWCCYYATLMFEHNWTSNTFLPWHMS